MNFLISDSNNNSKFILAQEEYIRNRTEMGLKKSSGIISYKILIIVKRSLDRKKSIQSLID